jgi:hypothetical protein
VGGAERGRDLAEAGAAGIAPTVTTRRSGASSRASAIVRSAVAIVAFAPVNRRAPPAVAVTPRGWRSSRRTPTASSRARIAWVSAGCARCSRRAAALIWPSSTTATK